MLELTENIPDTYGEVAFYWWVGEPLKKERLKWQLDQLKNHHICALQINYCHGDRGGLNYGLTMDSEPPVFSDAWWELVEWFVKECKKQGIAVALSDYTLSAPGQEKYMDAILRQHPEYIGKKLVLQDGNVTVKSVEHSVNPMEEKLGDAVIEAFFAQFDKRFPDEMGKSINFFFSDELVFNIDGRLWDDVFSREFQKRKRYAIEPYLKGLFEDIGPITQKIRLDYYDVIVSRMEEGYFKKVYEWNQTRGMTMGCDHGGRGLDITEFGDYFRTQRWNQGPGNDQPNLESHLIKSKVSASIAHMYQRPRVWLEGFYGSGWGTSSAELADAIFRNFALGHNLLTLHGLYYTTFGGYWEWAPPCNHFRMPYWKHMEYFLSCTKTLSYLLSQGTHVCDVAILYPIAAIEGGIDAQEAGKDAFALADILYKNQIDFDFIDHQSIERAKIKDGKLCVSGESFSVLIIPSMSTIRYCCIEKAYQMKKQGGTVILFGRRPIASERKGREDALLDEQVSEIEKQNGIVKTYEDVLTIIRNRKDAALDFYTKDNSGVYFHHRRWEGHDIYFAYNINKDSECFFRSHGRVTILDPWTKQEKELKVLREDPYGTWLKAPLENTQMQIFVFDTNKKQELIQKFNQKPLSSQASLSLKLDKVWEVNLIPTMDNRFGDFRLPVEQKFIGSEADYFLIEECTKEKSKSKKIRYSVGTYFYQIGPVKTPDDESVLNAVTLAEGDKINLDGIAYPVKAYDFSMRSGIEGDAGYQHSYHGLKGYISDEFIALGKKRITQANSNSVYEKEDGGTCYYLYTRVLCDKARSVIINQGKKKADKIYLDKQEIDRSKADCEFLLSEGVHELLLRYDTPGRTWFVLEDSGKTEFTPFVLSMKWYKNPNILPFGPKLQKNIRNQYRYDVRMPAECHTIHFSSLSQPEVFIDGIKNKCNRKETDCFGVDRYEIKPEWISGGDKEECRLSLIVEAENTPGGAIITEPVLFECGKYFMELGDWGKKAGLETYSGGIRYKKVVYLDKAYERCILNLGEVGCSAEVFVNGVSVGIHMTEPYTFCIDKMLGQGENTIEVEVYNTLYNYYRTIPTQYNKKYQVSGLIGPVYLECFD